MLVHMSLRLFALCLMLGLLTACVTESRRVDEPAQPRDGQGLPQQVLRVPQQMQDLSGDLLRYHAKYKSLPETIDVLVDTRIMSMQRFAELPDYAYHPQGLGTLRDGRQVILVDAEVRIEGHAWCIVREPTNQPRTIQLNVTPIALTELEAAARQSP
jgi:hypothetical protein